MIHANFSQGLVLMVVGMGVVYLALAIMALVISAMRAALEAAPASTSVETTPALPEPEEPMVSPELLAVLTAAAFAVVKRPVRVRRVVMLGHHGSAWVAGGRATIMGSHRPHLHKPRG